MDSFLRYDCKNNVIVTFFAHGALDGGGMLGWSAPAEKSVPVLVPAPEDELLASAPPRLVLAHGALLIGSSPPPTASPAAAQGARTIGATGIAAVIRKVVVGGSDAAA